MRSFRSVLRRVAAAVCATAALSPATGPARAAPPGEPPRARADAVTAPAGALEPVAPAQFVALRTVAPGVREELRYATRENFLGDRVDGYRQPLCLLTRPAAEALARAQSGLLRLGYTLKVYDCYRPQRAVDRFVRWAGDPQDRRMQAEFYPRVDKSRLLADGYLAERSGHSRGGTVDLTLVRLPGVPVGVRPEPGRPAGACHGPAAERRRDDAVDMGTAYDCFDPRSHTDHPGVSGAQRAHRDLLRRALGAEGFVNLPEEWWHFTHRPEVFPDTYFDFPVAWRSLARGEVNGSGRAG